MGESAKHRRQEDTQMANEHMKRGPIFQVIREMKIHTTTRIGKVKDTTWSGCGALEFSCIVGGGVSGVHFGKLFDSIY